MITTNTGAKKLEASDNWREIFPNPDLSTAGAHNASVDAADRIQPEIAPIINGKQCALGAASGDYVLLRNSTITGKSDGAYIATKAIPANTDIDSTYLGNAITGGISNSLNSNLTGVNFTFTLSATGSQYFSINSQKCKIVGGAYLFSVVLQINQGETVPASEIAIGTVSRSPSANSCGIASRNTDSAFKGTFNILRNGTVYLNFNTTETSDLIYLNLCATI